MRIATRSNMILFIAVGSLAANWFFDGYETRALPGWLEFTRSAYGLFAGSLLSSLLMLALFYFMYQEFREMEGISRRIKATLKWSFYGLLGVTALSIPFEIAIFLGKLHANG